MCHRDYVLENMNTYVSMSFQISSLLPFNSIGSAKRTFRFNFYVPTKVVFRRDSNY
jgi:hypothetical protein